MSVTGDLLRALADGGAPASFGPDEVDAARSGCGLALRPGRRTLAVSGAARHEFLNRMLTVAVRERPSGEGRRALLLDNKGRLQADLDLFEAGDQLLAIGETTAVELAVEGLRRFVLRADVTFEPRVDPVLALVGPEIAATLAAFGAACAGGRPSRAAAEIAGCPVELLATSALPQGIELTVAAAGAEQAATALLEAGAVPLGADVLETLRVEAGVPAAAHELADAPFPQEVRLDGAVDFDKGCYVGQETVARIHYRGHVNRLLCGLALDAPVAGGELEHEGRAAGRVTSAVVSDRLGPIALAMVRDEQAAAGTVLTVRAGEGPPVGARVVELPFD